MKIKLKLTRNEFVAFYNVLSELVPAVRRLPDEQERTLRLQNLAVREIMTNLFMKLTVKLEALESEKSIALTLKMHEAWALNKSLNSIIDLLDTYAMTTCLRITGEINRRTV